MNLATRSYTRELLDGDNIAFEDIKRNMQELEFINKYLGGHRITIKGIENLVHGMEERKENATRITICEIGCGGGDNLKAINSWCRKKNIQPEFIGIDINEDCICYAKENCDRVLNKEFIISDYKQVRFSQQKPDIIFSSLFCHHFNDSELVEMLEWCRQNSGIGFFINDLHRHSLAYYAIKFFTTIFSRSYLVKNDAPLSVQRGFKKQELKDLLHKAHISNFKINWQWAFRWLVIVFPQRT